jgi:hypothetical protein
MDEIKTPQDCWGTPQSGDAPSLAARFIQELLDQPEDSEPIPLGATVILMPPEDDPEPDLAATNLRVAEGLVAEGRTVILWTVGKEPPFAAVTAESSLAATTDA